MKIAKLENLIYLTVFLLPAYLIKLDFWGIPFNLLEALILAVLVWSWLIVPKEKWFEKKTRKYLIAFGLIISGLAISTILNENYKQGAGIIKGWFLLPFLFGLAVEKHLPEEKRKTAFISYFLSAFFTAGVSLIFLVLGKVTYDFRLEAFFNSPNYLAMYLAPALLVLSQIKNYNLKLNLFLPVAGLTILVALFFTYSYAAWIAIIISLLFIEVVRKKYFGKKVCLVILIFFTFLFFEFGKSKLNNLTTLNVRSSLASRIMIWKSAGKMLEDNWLWGVGPGRFQEEYLEYQKYFPPYLEWAVPHPHNLFLAFWLSGGLASIAGFLFLLFSWAKEVLAKKEKSDVFIIALGIIIYFLLHGLADTTYFKNDLSMLFWVVFFSV